MPRIEFRCLDTGRLLAQAEDEASQLIPVVGDRVYAPSAAEAGVYSHYQVGRREFYYDQRGQLALIKLECLDVASQPVARPSGMVEVPNGVVAV